MKTAGLVLSLLAIPAIAADRYVTVTETKPLRLNVGEAAELKSMRSTFIEFAGDDGFKTLSPTVLGGFGETSEAFFIAGPGTIKLISSTPSNPNPWAYATFKVYPGVSDPNSSVMLVPTTNSVTVRLESSTNLVDWATAATVTLTNVPSATFFRARTD